MPDVTRLLLSERGMQDAQELPQQFAQLFSVGLRKPLQQDGFATQYRVHGLRGWAWEIDVSVNNARGSTDFDRDTPSALDDVGAAWRSNFESNVVTAELVTTALVPKIRAGGTVVTIGSIASKGAGSYGAAKAAIAS